MLAAVTVLARTLSLAEFGTYGLLVSFSTYLLVVQGSLEATAVREIAQAGDRAGRDRAFSHAFALYAGLGTCAGALIALAGLAALGLFDIPARLEDDAQTGVLLVALGTALGWPAKTYHDLLRGSEAFVLAAVAEATGYIVVGAALIAGAAAGSPLWALIGVGAALPLAIGIAAAVIVYTRRLGGRLRLRELHTQTLRRYLGFSGYLLFASATDVIIYSLDRAILGAFRSAATVGLYEGPARAHNLIRQLNATLMGTVLPSASRYIAEGDIERQRALILRGSRYVLAAVTPLTIVLMALSEPILEVWLGDRFTVAATAMSIFVAYWLVGASAGVPSFMILAAGHVRWLAFYAWAHAGLSLSLSLALTAWLGLDGLVLGTTVAYLAVTPFLFRKLLELFPLSLGEFAREVWVPAYVTGAGLAVFAVAARLALQLDSVAAVVAVALAGVTGYWLVYYAVWLRPSERALVRNLVRPARGA